MCKVKFYLYLYCLIFGFYCIEGTQSITNCKEALLSAIKRRLDQFKECIADEILFSLSETAQQAKISSKKKVFIIKQKIAFIILLKETVYFFQNIICFGTW